MKYLDKLEQLERKVILRTARGNDRIYLIFVDDFWTALESTEDPYDGGVGTPRIVPKSVVDHNDEHCAGLIDREEYIARGQQMLKNAERARKERDKREYERLKLIFEK